MPIMVPPAVIVTSSLRYQWIDPNGNVHDLSRDYSPSIFIETGSLGLNYPSFEISDSKLPLSPGSLINKINTNPRRITIPIVIYHQTMEDLLESVSEVTSWFDTGDELSRRPGYFRVIRPDDSVRQIQSYYITGLEGATNVGGPNWTKYAVELYCSDPYPVADEDTVVIKDQTNFALFAIINQGELDAYPIIELTGRVLHFNMQNVTKGQNISGQIDLADGETLTIDTRPSELRDGPSVYDDSGTNLLSIINTTSVWWTLQPGSNNLSFSTNASTGVTRVQVTYLPRYRTLFR